MRKIVCVTAFLVVTLSKYAVAQTDTTFYYQPPLFEFKERQPMFDLRREQIENKNRHLRYFSFTGYREGVEKIKGLFGANFDANNDLKLGVRRIYMFNLTIEEMVTHGLPAKVLLEVADPSKYRYDKSYGDYEIWKRKNTYCFEYMMPIGMIKGLEWENEIMENFGIIVSKEKRKTSQPDSDGAQEEFVTVIREVNR